MSTPNRCEPKKQKQKNDKNFGALLSVLQNKNYISEGQAVTQQ